jgi:hypothetical protein
MTKAEGNQPTREVAPALDDVPWWRDVDHCRELVRWLNDGRVTSLNAARVVLHGSASTVFVRHLERKAAALLALRFYRSAWANLDQLISGIEIVDPLHPSVFRARLLRLMAMACSGYACCGTDEVEYWEDVTKRLCPDAPQILLDYSILSFVVEALVGGRSTRIDESAAALQGLLQAATDAEPGLVQTWLAEGGMLTRLAAAHEQANRLAARIKSVVYVPLVGPRRLVTPALDRVRLSVFRAHQGWEMWAIRRTVGVVHSRRSSMWQDLRTGGTGLGPPPPWRPYCATCHRCGRRRRFRLRMDSTMFVSGQIHNLASAMSGSAAP